MVMFGTLNSDGTLSNIRHIEQADIRRCRHCIIVADHYRANGSCKCDDPVEQARMIREWGYSAEDFSVLILSVRR